jgi:excisionase family DNA binding protein
MDADTIMKVRQIAEYLQTDEHTIYRLARKGQIPAFKLSGQWRFKKDLIDKWIEKKSFENSEEPFKEASS